jgi:hypothetical protein
VEVEPQRLAQHLAADVQSPVGREQQVAHNKRTINRITRCTHRQDFKARDRYNADRCKADLIC